MEISHIHTYMLISMRMVIDGLNWNISGYIPNYSSIKDVYSNLEDYGIDCGEDEDKFIELAKKLIKEHII